MTRLSVRIKPARRGGYDVYVKFPNHWFYNSHHANRRKAERERADLRRRFKPDTPERVKGWQWDRK